MLQLLHATQWMAEQSVILLKQSEGCALQLTAYQVCYILWSCDSVYKYITRNNLLHSYSLIHHHDHLPRIICHEILAQNTPLSSRKGHSLKCIQLSTSIDAYKYSFFSSAIKFWNILSTYITESHSLQECQTKVNN